MLLFGGSFDPIHHGHLIVCRSAAEQIGAARIILIPSASPPHKQQVELTPADVRLELCRLAVEGDPLFEVSDWETRQTGPNYTLHTVRHFREALPAGTEVCWLIGMDSLAELSTWYRVDELASLCTLVTAGRPDAVRPERTSLREFLSEEQTDRIEAHILSTPLIEISATDIRARVRAGKDVRYLVPEPVWRAISERGLYRE